MSEDTQAAIAASLQRDGFAFLPAEETRAWLGLEPGLPDWAFFRGSWDRLGLDGHMADRGRYRRRRHAVFAAAPGQPIALQPQRAHFQDLRYNPLNGGIARWFEPIEPAVAEGAVMVAILEASRALFDRREGQSCRWDIESHQFRIEARPGEAGLPTPEGMHRDGVDHVLALLVQRRNVRSGTTLVGVPGRGVVGSFTLADPMDAALVDDHRVHHAVTPVLPVDPALPAWRDVLVVTFRRDPAPD